MTLKISPVQLDIIIFLKAPGNTPEDYAKLKGVALSTVYGQLRRLRLKDKQSRIFHAQYNGLMGSNPNLRGFMKVVEGLTPQEKATVDRQLQNPKQALGEPTSKQRNVVNRRKHGKPKHHGSLLKKRPNRANRKV